MSIINDIFEIIINPSSVYGISREYATGIPRFKKYKQSSVRSAFSRLNKNGLIKKDSSGWVLTKTGREYHERKKSSLQQFLSPFSKDAPKNLLVMFDIPENMKGERDWFRFHLKKYNYLMIQKSVWIGPSPLPKEFLEYTTKIGLKESIKTFKLAKGYTEK